MKRNFFLLACALDSSNFKSRIVFVRTIVSCCNTGVAVDWVIIWFIFGQYTIGSKPKYPQIWLGILPANSSSYTFGQSCKDLQLPGELSIVHDSENYKRYINYKFVLQIFANQIIRQFYSYAYHQIRQFENYGFKLIYSIFKLYKMSYKVLKKLYKHFYIKIC